MGCCSSVQIEKYISILEEIFKSYSQDKIEKAHLMGYKEVNNKLIIPSQMSLALTDVDCLQIHIKNKKNTIISYLILRPNNIKVVGDYLRNKITGECQTKEKIMALLLFKELMKTQFPINVSGDSKTHQMLNECEDQIVDSLNYIAQSPLSMNQDIITALLKTLETYTKLKHSQPNFQRLSLLYSFIQKTMTFPNIETRKRSLKILFNMILLMSTSSLNKYKTNILKVNFNLLIENSQARPYPSKEAEQNPAPSNHKEQNHSDHSSFSKQPEAEKQNHKNKKEQKENEGNEEKEEDLEDMEEFKLMEITHRVSQKEHNLMLNTLTVKELCVDTIAYLIKKLDETGNIDHQFLDPIFAYFRNTNWLFYKLAAHLFANIIQKFSHDQLNDESFGCFSIMRIFHELGNELIGEVSASQHKNEIHEKCRVLLIMKKLLKTPFSESIAIFCLEKYRIAFPKIIKRFCKYEEGKNQLIHECFGLYANKFEQSSYVFQLISAIIDIILESINEMEKIESLEEIGIFHETILMLYSYLRDSFQFLMKFPPNSRKLPHGIINQIISLIKTKTFLHLSLEALTLLLRCHNLNCVFGEVPTNPLNEKIIFALYPALYISFEYIFQSSLKPSIFEQKSDFTQILSVQFSFSISNSSKLSFDLWKIVILNATNLNNLFISIPFITTLQNNILNITPEEDSFCFNYLLLIIVLSFLIRILSLHYNIDDLWQFLIKSINSYDFLLELKEILIQDKLYVQDSKEMNSFFKCFSELIPTFIFPNSETEYLKEIFPKESLIQCIVPYLFRKHKNREQIKFRLSQNFGEIIGLGDESFVPQEDTIETTFEEKDFLSESHINSILHTDSLTSKSKETTFLKELSLHLKRDGGNEKLEEIKFSDFDKNCRSPEDSPHFMSKANFNFTDGAKYKFGVNHLNHKD